MKPELFIYWRTRAGAAEQAEAAVARWQASLRAAAPGLEARLYRRTDDAGSAATLMETYAGFDAALERRLRDEGDALSVPWREGVRHVEAFERRG